MAKYYIHSHIIIPENCRLKNWKNEFLKLLYFGEHNEQILVGWLKCLCSCGMQLALLLCLAGLRHTMVKRNVDRGGWRVALNISQDRGEIFPGDLIVIFFPENVKFRKLLRMC